MIPLGAMSLMSSLYIRLKETLDIGTNSNNPVLLPVRRIVVVPERTKDSTVTRSGPSQGKPSLPAILPGTDTSSQETQIRAEILLMKLTMIMAGLLGPGLLTQSLIIHLNLMQASQVIVTVERRIGSPWVAPGDQIIILVVSALADWEQKIIVIETTMRRLQVIISVNGQLPVSTLNRLNGMMTTITRRRRVEETPSTYARKF